MLLSITMTFSEDGTIIKPPREWILDGATSSLEDAHGITKGIVEAIGFVETTVKTKGEHNHASNRSTGKDS